MCTCAVVGNGAIIEAPATGVERACDRLSVAPLLRATALAVPGTLVTGMMPCGCVCLRRRVAPGLPMNPRPGPARARVSGGSTAWGPPTGWHRLRLLRQIGDQLVAGLEQFLLVDNVIAVEDGAALVPVRSMATRSGTFARIRLRAAVRRQSWRKRVGTPSLCFYSSLRLITINTITSCVFIGLQRIDLPACSTPFMLITGPPGV